MEEAMTIETALKPLDAFVGNWTTEAKHPAFPGGVVRGEVNVEWLEGKRFLIHRSRTDHPDFPDSISIIGFTERDRVDKAAKRDPGAASESQLSMHYFDSRGVFRLFDVRADAKSYRFERLAPGFSQRFTGTLTDDGNTILGQWQLCEDATTCKDDLQITYRRRA
jgi:hypothetical protein